MTAQRIIVTGGAGYIGSHVAVELLAAGRDVLIIDNFANSHPKAIERIAEIAGRTPDVLVADLARPGDAERIIEAAAAFGAEGAIHLAGLKAVGESVSEPMRYYETNIAATFALVRALGAANGRLVVFSSSATVYGDRNSSPVDESGLTGPTNPYGRTKLFIEEMLKDLARSDPRWKACNLRYFNPVGAHASGLIGEDPFGAPNNLFPFIAQVAVGRRAELKIFGNDYPTRDGTGVRDYIHVSDLAAGHLAALDYLSREAAPGAIDVNLGTGSGVSVLEAVAAFKRASNRDIAYRFAPRRDGDIAEIFARCERAQKLFGWRATRTLGEMCADHWRWQSANPNGYRDCGASLEPR